jgi:hypothetical protein
MTYDDTRHTDVIRGVLGFGLTDEDVSFLSVVDCDILDLGIV